MARAGLGKGWHCLFANDCDELKKTFYNKNWQDEHFDGRDVALVETSDLQGLADMAWASFPCQDVSLAGAQLGIGAADGTMSTRSGAVWPFLSLVRELARDSRHPVLLTLENVPGLLSSNEGADFKSLCTALGDLGYRFGAVVADAAHFVPQSRPRVFIIALRREVPIPAHLTSELPANPWHSQSLLRARAGLPANVAANWVWWSVGDVPMSSAGTLADIVDLSDQAEWNTDEATARLVGMISDIQRNRLNSAKQSGKPMIGSLYLRMRPNGKGGNIQRAEIAFGETLGCLRTPKGGASRPRIIVVEGERVRTRLLSPREAASLMGLSPEFILPTTYNESFRLIGDGVVPQVVRFLADRLLEPLAIHARTFVTWQANQKASA